MGEQPEALFKAEIKNLLVGMAKKGLPVRSIRPADAITRGIPDLVICINGWYVEAELKINTPLLELQRKHLMLTARAAGTAGVYRKMSEGHYQWTKMLPDGQLDKVSDIFYDHVTWVYKVLMRRE